MCITFYKTCQQVCGTSGGQNKPIFLISN